MNFIKGLFSKIVHKEETQSPTHKEQIDDRHQFSIRCELLEQDIPTKKQKFVSNTSIVTFDRNKSFTYNHIMIIRVKNAIQSYDDKLLQKTGDYYFTMCSLNNLEEQQINDNMEIRWVIDATTKGILRFKNVLQPKNSNNNDGDYTQFRSILQQFCYENKYLQTYTPMKELALKTLINYLPPKKFVIKREKRNPYPTFGANYIEQFIKSKPEDLDKHVPFLLTPVKRTQSEKQQLGDVLLQVQNSETVLVLFSGTLHIIRESEIELLHRSVIISIHQYASDHCYTLEIRSLNNKLIILDDIDETLNYQTDIELNYLKWLHLTDTQADVYIVRFDGMDSAMTVRVYIEQGKVQQKEIQEQQAKEKSQDDDPTRQEEQKYQKYDDKNQDGDHLLEETKESQEKDQKSNQK